MRALGVYPSDKDIVDVILPQVCSVWVRGCPSFRHAITLCTVLSTQMQDDEPSSFVTFDRFEQKMLELLESDEYAPDSEDTLLAAFRVRASRGVACRTVALCVIWWPLWCPAGDRH